MKMAEYISRKAAIAYIREQSEECQKAFEELGGESGIYADAYNDLAEDFCSIPAADVAPVVHGQWIIGVDDDDFDVKCSKCEWTDIFEVAGIAAVERIAKTMHYCLNCGAKMDGGTENAAD